MQPSMTLGRRFKQPAVLSCSLQLPVALDVGAVDEVYKAPANKETNLDHDNHSTKSIAILTMRSAYP